MLTLYPYKIYEHQLPEELCKGIIGITKAEFKKARRLKRRCRS
jgi:hypothetical protein